MFQGRGVVLALLLAATAAACATMPAIGGGGPVYQVTVSTVNGYPTALSGPAEYPACVIQVGNRVARVWLAHPSRAQAGSPVVLEGDAEALKSGVLIERSWREAVVHKVTDLELASGAAVVYVPGARLTVVELEFRPVSGGDGGARAQAAGTSRREDDLAERGPLLQGAVAGGHVGQR